MFETEAQRQSSKEFLDAIAPSSFLNVFDDLFEVFLTCKDLNGHYQITNACQRNWLNLSSLQNSHLPTDADFYPLGHAEYISSFDQQVIRFSKPLINSIEHLFDHIGEPTWFISNRYPIYAKASLLHGITIVRKRYPYLNKDPEDHQISIALNYITNHYYREVTIPHLAELTSLSVRQFERRFKQQLLVTPQDFIVRFRVTRACEQLRSTSTSLAEISDAQGFYDQAAFSKQFKKHFGINPLNYRKEYSI